MKDLTQFSSDCYLKIKGKKHWKWFTSTWYKWFFSLMINYYIIIILLILRYKHSSISCLLTTNKLMPFFNSYRVFKEDRGLQKLVSCGYSSDCTDISAGEGKCWNRPHKNCAWQQGLVLVNLNFIHFTKINKQFLQLILISFVGKDVSARGSLVLVFILPNNAKSCWIIKY